MPIPWLQLIDAALGVANFARSRKTAALAPAADEQLQEQLQAGGRVPAALEARLASVVVAALKEAFDRDSRRLELERDQLAAERLRAERALRLEMLRQAGDREIGRLRLLAGIAVVSWLGTLFFSARLIGGSIGTRVALGTGWLLLLAAVAATFVAQSQVAASLDSLTKSDDGGSGSVPLTSGAAGLLALWLIVCGLGLVCVAVLVA
jgi:hypothetical protein